jgi:glycosyltransferase involved in cell wall biosynthesis
VHFLGAKDYKSLPGYIRGFDVATIPFLKEDYLSSAYPLKINEYLAVGKPVVSTDFADLSDFWEKITIAEASEKFISGIENGLSEDNAKLINNRKKLALENSWDNRASMIYKTISDITIMARSANGKYD